MFDLIQTEGDRDTVAEPSIAVAIPCYNEAAAIVMVVAEWRAALPGAEIVVFDNNSTDGTGDLARSAGVRVIPVSEQGKGCVVRAIFESLADRDVILLVDGDGTYPASEAARLIAPILADEADMTVGARRPIAGEGAMTPIRGFGNRLIRLSFFLLIGRAPGDLLSGYRAFHRRFRDQIKLRSTGFEIETELTAEAVAAGLRVVEIPVPYHPRIAGSSSKLRAFRDGRRILTMIVLEGLRRRPLRILNLSIVPLGLLLWASGIPSLWIAAIFATLFVLARLPGRRGGDE